MKSGKKEVLRIIVLLILQIAITYVSKALTGEKWSIGWLVTNYVFISFWVGYIIVTLVFKLGKKSIDNNANVKGRKSNNKGNKNIKNKTAKNVDVKNKKNKKSKSR